MHARADRADQRPRIRLYQMIIVVLRRGHCRASLFVFALALASRRDSFHRIKCVAQRDLVDVLGVGILLDRRIDEKHHRHVDLLARLKRLLGEAEALDLLEIFADRVGRDIVDRLAGDRLAR